MTNIGKVYPSEKREFRDPETGAEVIQYTQAGKTNRTLYFTNRPYVNGGAQAVFLSDRTGRNEMYLLDLASGRIVQVTDLAGQKNVSNCVHPLRPELYFHNTQSLFRVNLDTLKTEELLRTPAGYRIGILNLNRPPWLAFEMAEEVAGISLAKPDPVTGEYRLNADDGNIFEKHHLRPRTLLYRYNVDIGKLECVWGEFAALSHVQISPTNPDLMIYSDFCGQGRDRVWYLDLRKRIKYPPRPLLGETATSRGTHECFTRQGNLYLQWMEGDLQENGEHQLMHAFKQLAGCPTDDVQNAPFRRYAVPEKLGYMCHHFTMSNDEQWGVHDRWLTAPTYKENLSSISVFRHQANEPQTVVVRVCSQNGADGDRLGLGVDLTLDDRDEFGLYTSFLGGTANICQVRVTPFVEKLLK